MNKMKHYQTFGGLIDIETKVQFSKLTIDTISEILF
jgi:hypothetical protein